MVRKYILMIGAGVLMTGNAMAAVVGKTVEYKASDGIVMEGYLAYDDANPMLKPGILVVHDWMGLKDFEKDKANKLAAEGYVAFAVDVYGKGVRPANQQEARLLADKYKSNRVMLRSHMKAAYDALEMIEEVEIPTSDTSKFLVMGYCFGGTAALELARTGANLAGTVVFHGGLSNPIPSSAANIKGKVLVLHGAEDPFVPPTEVNAFRDEMEHAGVEVLFIAYPGAVHAFTEPHAGNDVSKGAAYNAEADKASWAEFQRFLEEVL